jgi:hypothetical protein
VSPRFIAEAIAVDPGVLQARGFGNEREEVLGMSAESARARTSTHGANTTNPTIST